MSNDDRLVRRDGSIPVSVRRPLAAGFDPSVLSPQPSQTGDTPAPVSPQIIYINNAPPPAPIPLQPLAPELPAPAGPTIHHHHYTVEQPVQRVSLRLPKPPTHSALGVASLALGIICCVVCWVPWLGLVAVPVGAIGALLGVLGVLISLLFRRSSAGLPLSGIFVCCLAAGISIASTKSLPYWRSELDKVFSTVIPRGVLPQGMQWPHASGAAAPAPPPPPPFAMPSLFGPSPAVTPAAGAAPSAPNIAPSMGHAASVPPPALSPAIAVARDQLAAAEKACDQRTMQTAEYQAAVKAADDARAHAASLRQTAAPGSDDLKQASQQMIAADDALNAILRQAQASDPQVAAAEQALAAARSEAGH